MLAMTMPLTPLERQDRREYHEEPDMESRSVTYTPIARQLPARAYVPPSPALPILIRNCGNCRHYDKRNYVRDDNIYRGLCRHLSFDGDSRQVAGSWDSFTINDPTKFSCSEWQRANS